ncbi:type II and III secretion system protein family protein [Helicobacter cappadocius]|uniref:Pilus assembly protein N-terminal domain-containing protein n=1 Tax=Helicobacter cappadocius TaxID=3063998 RepID=A0AA90PKC6_9HELI|nr:MULTISPECIES: pilus assembly protein N-terminal domain-containing protein [unclassified Helicobacter]MDO7253125.1 pilus assembly protein N-terminal domain-containing protein [Helicobacter sp. faydin-H75]MDP2538749.1 pilus assembly protein N-terminal domain-containing protein [Helicobacter sp. faydin-H76]
MAKTILTNIILWMLVLCFANAEEIIMQKGKSKVFSTTKDISTVFTSDPKIVDYKIINNKKVVIYANDNGFADVKIFGKELLVSLQISVDPYAKDLDKISKLIESKLPDSSIKITKLGIPGEQGYVITGVVTDEGSRDSAYNMAALALGLELEKKEKDAISADRTSQRTSSEGDKEDNSLDFLARYETPFLIDKLKIKLPNQVNVKLIVADIEKNLVAKLGLDFNAGTYALPLITNGVLGLSQFNMIAIVDAFKDEQMAKILAEPNLSVLSGENAQFSVTGQYTPITNSVTYGGQPVSSPGTAKDYGISLTIQPKVESNEKITVRISQEVSNIQSIIEKNGASAANLKKRRAESVFQVANGESFIIGGLLDERDNENVRSVPFLGDIPLIGALFRKTSITRSKTELIIIATVTLAHPVSKDISINTYEPRSIAESFFNFPYHKIQNDKEEIKIFFQNIGFIK